MLGLNISLTEILSRWTKRIFSNNNVKRKLRPKLFIKKVRIYENLKPNSSVSLLTDPDSVVKELKHVHLKRYNCLNALKATFSVLTIVCYGWKVRRNYNRVQKQNRLTQIQK